MKILQKTPNSTSVLIIITGPCILTVQEAAEENVFALVAKADVAINLFTGSMEECNEHLEGIAYSSGTYTINLNFE